MSPQSLFSRFLRQPIQSAFGQLFDSFAKNGRFIAGITLMLFIAIIFFFARLQRRESARFSQILDLHLAMDHWRREPTTRADQLPHLCALFRQHPHMLGRFGGEFLSSALLLRGEMGLEGSNITKWFLAQQKCWNVEPVPNFMESTLMASRGEFASVVNTDAPLRLHAIDRSAPTSSKTEGQDALMAYHLIRCAACGYLSRDPLLFKTARDELSSAAGLLLLEGNGPQKRTIRQPFAALFDSYRTGRLTLLDWAIGAN